MTQETDLLTLAQWFSPAFPVGAFSYSHGLERAIDSCDVSDVGSLGRWIGDVVEHGAGRTDAIILAAAYGCETNAELSDVDARCRALAASRERLAETVQQGAAFCRTTAAIWHGSSATLTYPVAAGRAARLNDLPLGLTASMYLHGFVGNLVSVGMRLIPLGQTEGHRLIHDLAQLCIRVADDASHGDLDVLSSTTFLADIAAMHHETQHTRIFRS